MSDIILAGNQESPLLGTLLSFKKTDLSYRMRSNFPNLSKRRVILSTSPAGALTATDLSGQTQTFVIPRIGILADMVIEAQVATAGNNNGVIAGDGTNRPVQTLGGCALFSRIDLLSNSKQIATCTDGYLRVRQESSSMTRGLRSKMMSRFYSTDGVTVATTWSAQTVVTFCPVYFSVLENIYQNLDLNFCEQLNVQVTHNSYTAAGFAAPLTSSKLYLHLTYYVMQNDDLARLRELNFPKNGAYMALGYSVYQETDTIPDSSTSITIYPKVQFPCFATHIYLKNRTYNTLVPIKSVKVSMAGQDIISAVNPMIINSDSDNFGGGGLVHPDQYLTTTLTGGSTSLPVVFQGAQGKNRVVSIFWGADPADRTYNSGAVSFKNVPNLSLIHI